MTKQQEVPIWAIIGSIIVIIIVIIWSQWDNKRLHRNISENLSYSVATITKYIPPGGIPPSAGSIWAEFNIDGYLFETLTKGGTRSPGTKIPDSPKGKQYLIIYNAKNPEECILLWDYPINDSTDFRRYIEYLKKHPIPEFENHKR